MARPRKLPTDALDRRLGLAEELDLQRAGAEALSQLSDPPEPLPTEAPASLLVTGRTEVEVAGKPVVVPGVPLVVRVTRAFPYALGHTFKTADVGNRLYAAKFTETVWLGILRRREGCYVDETPIAKG